MEAIFVYLTTNKDAFTVMGVLLTLVISSISLWFSVKNNKAVHYVNSVTKNRVEWIDKLRKNIAEFISLLDTQDLTDTFVEIQRNILENEKNKALIFTPNSEVFKKTKIDRITQ